ncbi:metallophosphoesterase [Sporosarcina sp. HYO08]|uniref:metallophosphoesterase n=1 Tax=Sporosarcina sp. HYO08 TaxID=1759557 RepID=UPI000791A39F|nr:metallophosphoesterase [Sporosarcina sp. HYO08]KXH87282.1 hypothetical protein AU377_01530 [Sporosarcina sp. HYO08]
MKIIVLSDSHGDRQTIEAVAGLSADAIFHCGDSELGADDPVLKSMHVVRGNCDYDNNFPKSVIIDVKGKKVLAVHGHEHDVKRSLMNVYYSAKEQEADIVLFGHSHVYGAEMKDDILFVNPGSTLLPRGGNPATYAVIEWDETLKVTFKTMQHEAVNYMEKKFF